jgi:ATP-binding cassette, subfamily B, bacterial
VLVLVNGLLPVAFIIASGHLVGAIPAALRDGPGTAAADNLVTLIIVTGAIFALRQVAGPVRQQAVWELAWEIDLGLQQRVMKATIGPVGISHLEDSSSLDRIEVARGLDGWLGPGQAINALTNLIARWLAGAGSALVLITWKWWFGLALTFLAISNSSRSRREFRKVAEVLYGVTSTFRRADYVRDLALKPLSAKETRVFGLRDWLTDRYRTGWTDAMTPVWQSRGAVLRAFLTMAAVFVVARVGAYLYIGFSGTDGTIDLATTAVLLQAIGGLGVLSTISDDDLRLAHGTKPVPAALSLEHDTRTKLAVTGRGTLSAGSRPHECIRFEKVTFRYPGGESDVFTGLDLEIRAGQSLGVVGVNGAGKTTLVKLLARMYDPTEGRITVDGIDLRDFDAASWQRRLAAIFQDFIRYELPARDNVGFGALSHRDDSAALDRAAERAGAAKVIAGLPKGWDTVLSRQFSDGADISGGEWQRVALARALLAVEAGAGVLVLDEPTANLDVRSEAEIYARFLEITEGLTSIVISHRFSTVRRAERIIVIESGRLVEEGSHDSLVAADGRYAAMYRLQAARFNEDTEQGAATAVTGTASNGGGPTSEAP